MNAVPERPLYTVDEFLRLERASLDRHDLIEGRLFFTATETARIEVISENLAAILRDQIDGDRERVLLQQFKVWSGPRPILGECTDGMLSWADLLVVCGEVEYRDAVKDVVLNPRVIIDVLSPLLESFSRGPKRERYEVWNPSLTDNLLVAQDVPRIEYHQRQADGTWTQQTYSGLDAVFAIPSIQCTIALADVYDRVIFDGE